MHIIEWLDKLDTLIFLFIHHDSDAVVLDRLMPVLRHALTWIPLYLFMLIFAVRNFRSRALLFVMLSVLTFVLCDRLSAGVFKPLFMRSRPCFDEDVQLMLRNLVDCGGQYSFPSSHASNHFGLACFWYFAIKHETGKRWHWLWWWALAIGYAQIYVGKHFPLDIAGGALLGVVLGALVARIFQYWQFSFQFPIQRSSLEN